MRKIMLLMVVLLFILTGCSQKEESVPTFVMTEYNQEFMKDGVVTGTDCYTYSYNEDGLAIYRERYQDGSLFSCTSWEYDDYGNPVRITMKENGTVQISEYKNILDEDGRILQQELWVDDVRTTFRKFTYNRQGDEITHNAIFWHTNGELDGERSSTKEYNWKGELIKEVLISDNGDQCISDYQDGLCIRQTTYEAETLAVTETWEYTYDQKDRCIRQVYCRKDGDLEWHDEYLYDDIAKTMTHTSYNRDGTAKNYFDLFTYDEYGNQIMHERYQDGEVYWRISYVYEMLETAK